MFGTNVVLSADGNTALIGAWNDDSVTSGDLDYSGKGAAWVFTRSGRPGPSRARSSPPETRPERASSARSSCSPPTAIRR